MLPHPSLSLSLALSLSLRSRESSDCGKYIVAADSCCVLMPHVLVYLCHMQAYTGTCDHGRLIVLEKRTMDDHCGQCDGGRLGHYYCMG